MDDLHRLAELWVSSELLEQWLIFGNPTIVVEGMPADAKVVGAQFLHPRTVVLTLCSESFRPVRLGEAVPRMDPEPRFSRVDGSKED